MRKLFALVLALMVMFGGISFAEVQIDRGTTRGQAGSVTKFFVARNARQTAISADRVVIWDTASNDGISVTTTTTSFDNLVAGVTIDALPGITSDATAASGLNQSNWGRVKVWGRHANVSIDNQSATCSAGARIASGSLAGEATALRFLGSISLDVFKNGVSGDAFGVALEACAANNKSLDVFIQRG